MDVLLLCFVGGREVLVHVTVEVVHKNKERPPLCTCSRQVSLLRQVPEASARVSERNSRSRAK